MGKKCSEYRAEARAALKGKYWYSFGMCLLFSLVSVIVMGIPMLIAAGNGLYDVSMYAVNGAQGGIAVYYIVLLILTLAVIVPLNIGLIRFFILMLKGTDATVSEFIYPYKNGFVCVLGAEIKQTVFVYLWSLLFIIPGIIKAYSYFMVDYIIAENPGIGSSRAFEISKRAMRGYKGKAFLLELSFIGWAILAVIPSGLGIPFLAPYTQAAMAELYLDIKKHAVDNGIIAEGELPA